MENNKIAKLVSKKLYNPTVGETDFAIQLLIEKLVLPNDTIGYTDVTLEKYILKKIGV